MKFREHPLLAHGDLRVWPPVWVCLDPKRPQHVYGEMGTLKEVSQYETDRSVFLVMEYGALSYMGCLVIDDQGFRQQMSGFLRTCVGMTISDIGDLTVSFAPERN